MRYISIIGSLLLVSYNMHADTLASKIDSIINKELPNATVGILIKDAKNGRVFFSKNANKLLSPASNMKLFTAAAALYYWNPEHYFTTKLLQNKQDYYIHFGGSPSLTAANLNTLLSYFKTHNIKKINGNIILDTSLFKPPYYPNGVSYDDMGWYYAAPSTAIVLNENSVSYELKSAQILGEPATLKPKSDAHQLHITNELVTVDRKEKSQHCNLHLEIKPNNALRAYGCVVKSKNPQIFQFAVTDPEYLAKQVITKTLKQNEIDFRGNIVTGSVPSGAKLLAELRSNPLFKLIDHMLKESDNLYADNLCKQLAYALTKEGTNKQAIFALKEILSHHTTIDMKQLELADGIGTRYNLASAEQISLLLTNIYQDKKIYPLLLSALPQAGVSGTLKDRMKKTPLEKIVHAKTGTMHDISSLSGYLINPNGRPIIFSIIINGVNQPISKAKGLEEKILTLVNQEINEDNPEHSAFA